MLYTISRRTRQCILEKVSTNRVSIIVGPTGCGKSTQIPSLLLDELPATRRSNDRVLCTQPRRLAVVAVANHVTRLRMEASLEESTVDRKKKELEVGYHVGGQNTTTRQTRLVFSTAGMLLEELRSNGVDALLQFKVVLIDECHERSPESDLCLSIIKSFFIAHPQAPLRVILMSATFHHGRYCSYFQNVSGCDEIDAIPLETADGIDLMQTRVQTFYLEEALEIVTQKAGEGRLRNGNSFMLGHSADFSGLRKRMRRDPNRELQGSDGGKSLSQEMLLLIRALVLCLDEEESDSPESVFLIFAPTYRHLEQMFEAMSTCGWNLGVLHSSVDMEDCLRFINTDSNPQGESAVLAKDAGRKVLLASAIADSSVTIPGVTVVIDLCRALEVKWNHQKGVYVPKTVWASQSICDQRKGRTGRTCPGRVFRLMNRNFYIGQLEQWETPQILLSACRNEILALASSSSKKMLSDPVRLLMRCMDPPDIEVVQTSLEYLISIGACEILRGTGKQQPKVVPTEFGKLVAALPFDVDDSRAVVAAAQQGLLHEALVLKSIMSTRPYPILHHFAENARNEYNLQLYHAEANARDAISVALANLSAYMFWDHVWNGRRRVAALSRFYCLTRNKISEEISMEPFVEGDLYGLSAAVANLLPRADGAVWDWTTETEQVHTDWCRVHQINPTSVRTVAETVDSMLKVFYHSSYEPEWLRCNEAMPLWQRSQDWGEGVDDDKYLCTSPSFDTHDYMKLMFKHIHGDGAQRFCARLSPLCENTNDAVIARFHAQFEHHIEECLPQSPPEDAPVACIHFLAGNCTFGDKCRQSHSPHAVRPICRYYQAGNCTRGDKCLYLHSSETDSKSAKFQNVGVQVGNELEPIAPVLQSLVLEGGAKSWFLNRAEELFLLGEGDFSFTHALSCLGSPPHTCSTNEDSSPLQRGLTEVDATRLHTDRRVRKFVKQGEVFSFAWNFPFTGLDEDDESNEDLLLGTFLSLSILVGGYIETGDFSFALALQGGQFTRWSILRAARRSGWHLTCWSHFNPREFPGYKPLRANGSTFPLENGRFYVFEFRG